MLGIHFTSHVLHWKDEIELPSIYDYEFTSNIVLLLHQYEAIRKISCIYSENSQNCETDVVYDVLLALNVCFSNCRSRINQDLQLISFDRVTHCPSFLLISSIFSSKQRMSTLNWLGKENEEHFSRGIYFTQKHMEDKQYQETKRRRNGMEYSSAKHRNAFFFLV